MIYILLCVFVVGLQQIVTMQYEKYNVSVDQYFFIDLQFTLSYNNLF